MAKVKKFNIYMAIDSVLGVDELLTDNAKALLGAKQAYEYNDEGGGLAYIFPPYEGNEPKWVTDMVAIFSIDYDVRKKLRSKSPSALHFIKVEGRYFVITYGHAHVYLSDDKFVSDFGLKVAVNYIADNKVKEIEKSNLGVAIKDLAQSSSLKSFDEFSIGDVLDVIRKVSGESDSPGSELDGSLFARRVSGARGLKVSRKMEIEEIPTLLKEAFQLYQSKAYKASKFAIIDFLSPVSEDYIRSNLNDLLIHKFKKNDVDDFELSMPDIAHDDFGTYKYAGTGKAEGYYGVSLDKYLELKSSTIGDLKIDTLSKDKIKMMSIDDSGVVASASIYRSIYGSIDFLGTRYMLNDALWYSFEDADDKSVEFYIKGDTKPPRPNLPPFTVKSVDKKQFLMSEGEWNEEVAKQLGLFLLDAKSIPVPAQPGSKFELCDLLDLKERSLIHVKRSFRKSAPLSHLFKQGTNSAMQMRNDVARASAKSIISPVLGESNTDEFLTSISKPADWTVEFWLADVPKKSGVIEIPYFSKLSYRDERRKIKDMGYSVSISFIRAASPA